MWFFDDDPGFEEGPPDDEPTDAEVFKDNRWPFGATGTAEDVPAPTGASCVQISNALSRAEGNAGEYSFGGLADTLPVVPGLFVDGVGPISVPLCEEQAEKLITRCDKSPFGRKMDTLMDENVRKSWQLHPGHVQLKNPLWQEGIDKLSETIADRLGYKNVKMQCVLYKMLVYGEGGHFAKHQDTEKKDGMIATMVIQLPTLHEGGDLVVYQGKDTKYRHDFGKMDGTAAYLPHYAVQYADAEHALEKVTSGYRLVLVYSVCLPSEMHFLLEDRDKPLTEELTEAISRMGDDGDSFALLLAHEYTKKSIEDMGIGALKGVDRARFQALQDANAGVTPEKKLHFVIAGLTLKIDYYDAGGEWEENERDESIAWYSTSGEDHGNSSEIEELNMLNPRRETLADLWKNRGNSTFEGYLGNEGATRDTTYSRYAIVAWPAVRSVENSFKYISENAAIAAFQAENRVDAASLRKFMCKAIAVKSSDDSKAWADKFCCTLCELLVKVGDPDLVNMFFDKFCRNLNRTSNELILPQLIAITRAFDWSDFGRELLSSLVGRDEVTDIPNMSARQYLRYSGLQDNAMGTILRLANGLDPGAAQQAVLKVAVHEASKLVPGVLNTSRHASLLWKLLARCENKGMVETVANKFKEVDPKLLGPIIGAFSPHLEAMDVSNEIFAVFASVAAKRIEWLKDQIREREKPFSWEMPEATFPANVQIQEFLRGSGTSMTTKGLETFNRITEARQYASEWMSDQDHLNASFKMEASGVGRKAIVTITKTRDWHTNQLKGVKNYKSELKSLTKRFGGVAASNAPTTGKGKKRARLQ